MDTGKKSIVFDDRTSPPVENGEAAKKYRPQYGTLDSRDDFSDSEGKRDRKISYYEPFDPVNTDKNGLAWYEGSAIYINDLIGAGMLNFPYLIYTTGGVLNALAIQIVLLTVLFCSATTMVWCSHYKQSTQFQDTVFAYLGRKGQLFCSATMLLGTFLTSTTYLVAVGEQLSAASQNILQSSGTGLFTSEKFLVTVITIVIILPLCFYRSIDKFETISVFANVTVVLVTAVVIQQYFVLDTTNVIVVNRPFNVVQMLLITPSYAVDYAFDLASVAVYGRMKRRSVKDYMKSCGLALGLSFFFYNTLAGFCYHTFGSDIQPNFLTNYKEGSPFTAFAQIAFSIKLCMQYPLEQFIGWTSICTLTEAAGFRKYSVYEHDDSNEIYVNRYRFATTLIWITAGLMVTYAVSSIGVVLALVAFAFLQYQITFPGLCFFAASFRGIAKNLHSWQRNLMRFAGLLLAVIGTLASMMLIYHTVFDTSVIEQKEERLVKPNIPMFSRMLSSL